MIIIINTINIRGITIKRLSHRKLYFWNKCFAIRFFTIGCLFAFMTDYINSICIAFVSVAPVGTVIYFTKNILCHSYHTSFSLSLTNELWMIPFDENNIKISNQITLLYIFIKKNFLRVTKKVALFEFFYFNIEKIQTQSPIIFAIKKEIIKTFLNRSIFSPYSYNLYLYYSILNY